MKPKPKNIQEYKKWLEEEHSVMIDERVINYYESFVKSIHEATSNSEFWQSIDISLQEIAQKYEVKTGYPLMLSNDNPSILEKPFDSTLLKSFRKNILNNDNWPKPPHKKDWLLPNNWFGKIPDLIRTCFVVKYLDGVDYLCDEIENLSAKHKVLFRKYYEAREEGYYAVHIYITKEYEIPAKNWDTERAIIQFEIQITTQLQEVIRRLLHQYYEKNRINRKVSKKKWQWSYKENEFFANNLGHILHFVEGMILEVRDKKGVENEK